MGVPCGSEAALPFFRILVTGANGFVGRHLVPALAGRLATNARVTLASRTPHVSRDHATIPFDLMAADSVIAAITAVRPDLIIHLAAQASVSQSAEFAATTWLSNMSGNIVLAQAIAATVPECTVLQVSSAEVYGLTFNHEIVTETSPLRPQLAYAASKAAAEAMLADVLPPTVRLIIARPANHSGPGQDERFVVPAFAAQIARIEQGKRSTIQVGNLDAERDFLDVRDVVAAYLALLAAAPGLAMRTLFNIASGRPLRIGAILDQLRLLSPVEAVIAPDPQRMRPSEVARTAIDATLLRETVGWAPEHKLAEMFGDVLDYQRRRVTREPT